jgi:nitrite reductase (NADH) small subunit
MTWIRVTEATNIPLREARAVRIGDDEIAIFNLGDHFLACDNACPHRGGPLADGIVAGETVVCPLHAYRVRLDTGKVTKPEVCVKVETYETRVENGVVLVAMEKLQERAA